MRPKVSLIGAGSVVFAKKLMGDLLQLPALREIELCLMDIDPQRLRVAEVTAQRLVDALGLEVPVTATLDRREAVRGARYVVTMIQVGGYEPATVLDFAIPAKFGLRQTIADTLGPGGVFRGLRTIPKLTEIARDLAELGHPDAVLLNYSNPMAMNCRALDRAVGIPHVGLCHSVQGTSKQLAGYLDLSADEVTYRVAGLNHMAFFLELRYRGQDCYPLLFAAAENPAIRALDPVRFEMMKRIGYFVTESSEHQAEYVPYFIPHGEPMLERFTIPLDEYRRRSEAIIATWQSEEERLLGNAGGQGFQVEPPSQEYGAYIINAAEGGGETLIYGNVPNRGQISNLPLGACVEGPCHVDRQGLRPVHVGTLPPQLAALCQTNLNVQELTVEAALTGSREAIYHAVMLDPLTSATLPLDDIWRMCDELIAAHQSNGHLGAFKPVIAGTGRAWHGTGDRILASLRLADRADTATGSHTIELHVRNPRAETVNLSFQLGIPDGWTVQHGTAAIEVSVPAHEEVTETLVLDAPSAATRATAQLDLATSAQGVFCRGLTLRPQPIASPSPDGWTPVTLNLAGETAAIVSFRRDDEGLHVRAVVNDSNIKPAHLTTQGVRSGSGVELRLAAHREEPARLIYLLPPEDETQRPRAVDHAHNEIDGIGLTFSREPTRYHLKALIPPVVLGQNAIIDHLDAEVRAGLGALGDAHAGGRTALSGTLDPRLPRARYTRLRLLPHDASING